MNIIDWILMAVLTGTMLHFYFREKKTIASAEKRKEHPVEEAIRKEKQERTCPIICVVFQPELEDEELAAEIADMYLHGRAYYYTMGQTEINSCIIKKIRKNGNNEKSK